MRASLVVVLLLQVVCAFKTYDGHQIVRVYPQTDEDVHAVRNLHMVLGHEVCFLPQYKKPQVDFLTYPKDKTSPVDLIIPPRSIATLKHILGRKAIHSEVLIDDLGPQVVRDHERVAQQKTVTKFDSLSDFDLSIYNSYENISAYLTAVAAAYPSFVGIYSLGQSFERRNLTYLKFGYASGMAKKAIFIDAAIHGREWIAPAAALFAISQLTNASMYKSLLEKIDIYIAPLINTDGYEYTRNMDRFWRKTRSGPRQGCYGVEPNRNYLFMWGVSGTTSSPCSDYYLGPSPLSEVEIQAHANFLAANNSTFRAYLTLHSYGQEWNYPYAYAANTYPPDVADLKALGQQAVDAIRAFNGTSYRIGNTVDLNSPESGSSDDYAKSIGVKYVFTVALPPDANNADGYGYELPERFIIPMSAELFQGFLVFANAVAAGN